MRKLATIAAAAAIAIGAGTTPAAVAAPSGPQAQIACKNARIGGQSKCIAAGQFCARAYQRDYLRYGYSCSKRDRNGRYHLVRR